MHAKTYDKTGEPMFIVREEITIKSPPHSPAASAVAGGTFLALCQDCLHVGEFADDLCQAAAHVGTIHCSECGGEYCACSGCVADAEKIVGKEKPQCFTMRRDGYACGRPKSYEVCQHCAANAATWEVGE